MNVLVIAPHADDEILGCGGVIAKHIANGDNVYILVSTRGALELFSDEDMNMIRGEAREAHSFLKATETRFLDFEAPKLDVLPSYLLADAYRKHIKEWDIELMYIPHRGDIHKDHRAVFEAALVAARPVQGCPVKKILAYETLSETEWAAPFGDDTFIPNAFVNIEGFLDKKLDAMRFFKSQLRDFPSTRSIKCITALAEFRGATVGYEAAEAFMVIREITE